MPIDPRALEATTPEGRSGGLVADLLRRVGYLERVQATPVVSTLPTSPFDGQEIYFQNAAMATAGTVWRFRYRAASASAYKWEFVGGGQLSSFVDTLETTISTAYVDLTTVGPQVAVPLSGDYQVDLRALLANSGVGNTSFLAFKRGASVTSDADAMSTSTGWGVNVARNAVVLGVSSGAVLKLQARVAAGTGNFAQRALGLTPIRVG